MTTGKINWLTQRLTALLLLPLTFWFLYHFKKLSRFEYYEILIFFKSTTNSFIFCFMLLIMIYHGNLGMQTIIEDYISNKNLRNRTIIIIKILSYILMCISLLSVISIKYVNK